MTPDTEPTPFELFAQDATKRAQLFALLRDPVLAEAMEIANDLMRPKAGGSTETNQPLTIAKFHQSAGADEYQRLLKLLTKTPVERKPLKGRQLASSLEEIPLTKDT